MAVLLFRPMVRWLGMSGWKPAFCWGDVRRRRRFGAGFGLGAAAMGILGMCYVGAGVYEWTGAPAGGIWMKALLSGLVVGVLEESLFRGALAGLLERGGGRLAALWGTSAVFAAVHFLKPDPSVKVGAVHWFSGFGLVPSMFHQFTQPLLLLGGFGTLMVFGLVLGMAARRTGSLWLSIGLHGGLVFVKLVFAKGAELRLESLPWVGRQVEVGVWPILTLVLMGFVSGLGQGVRRRAGPARF